MTPTVVSMSTPPRATQLAVALALVPARRLLDEAVDDVVAERLGDPPLGDAGERAADTTPIARSTPTPMISAQPVTTVATATSPSSKRGTITLSITHRMTMLDATVQRAYTEAPPTAIANVFGCRLHHRGDEGGRTRGPWRTRRSEPSDGTDRFYQRARTACDRPLRSMSVSQPPFTLAGVQPRPRSMSVQPTGSVARSYSPCSIRGMGP